MPREADTENCDRVSLVWHHLGNTNPSEEDRNLLLPVESLSSQVKLLFL